MIVVYDSETDKLDATTFKFGCLYIDNKRQEFFFKKEDVWKRILELGREEMLKRRVLTVYSHNCQFYFYTYANLEDKNIRWFCLKPFIAEYRINGITAIKFLDSLGLFKMSLKELGKCIGLEKYETPKKFIEGLRPDDRIEQQDLDYCKRDCEIVYKSIEMLKDKLNKEGVNLRRMYTSSQIAINYFMNKLREMSPTYDFMFEDNTKIKLQPTKFKQHIHRAYRGGRVECWKTGKYKDVSYIDCNNLYGFSSMNIRFPDLKTEKFEYLPLRYNKLDDVLGKIGVIKAMVYNESNELGLLPIRTLDGNYFPKKGKYLVGIWTNIELQEAIKEGYNIIDIEWALTYEEGENPFKVITKRLYELRKSSDNEFDRLFYKEMQNRAYGKLAQRKPRWELFVDSVEKVLEYQDLCYKAIKGIGIDSYLYEKEFYDGDKNYYAPIIPTLINAWARVYMYKQFKKFDIGNLYYTDTDSCIFVGEIPKDVKIGTDIGEFKIVKEKKDAIFYGRKNYAIDDEVKIAGFRKKDMSMKEFEDGKIENLKMVSIKVTKDFTKVGKFEKEERDLKKDCEKFKESVLKMSELKVYLDIDIKNINFFMSKLNMV